MYHCGAISVWDWMGWTSHIYQLSNWFVLVTVLRASFAQIKRRIKVERLLYTGVHCQDGIANAPRGTIGERGHSHLCCQN